VSGESFAETAVLVAIMDDDVERADELLDDFLPSDLLLFHEQAYRLEACIRRARRRKVEGR
jgi:hypothetical protein